MKGIIFTEFLELVEDKFGVEMVDKIINKRKVSHPMATNSGNRHHCYLTIANAIMRKTGETGRIRLGKNLVATIQKEKPDVPRNEGA